MRFTGRLASIATAATGLAILIGGASAMASRVDLYACQFSMRAATTYFTFSFTSDGAYLPTVCNSARIVDGEEVQGIASTTVRITGGGDTTLGHTLACGIGTVSGSIYVDPSAYLATNGSPPPQKLSGAVTLTFVGGQGTMNIFTMGNGEAGGGGEGYVSLVPDDARATCLGLAPDNPNFMLEGAFTAALHSD